MLNQEKIGSPKEFKLFSGNAGLWLWVSIVAVLLAIIGNIIALAVPSIYAKLTPAFFPQAIAQDIASLAIVSPLWIILSILALRGSLRAYLVWLGVLTFTVYNYVIYTFSVPFGSLFLLWVAVLGLSLYALIGGVASINHESVKALFKSQRAVTFVAWFLIVVAILFALLWLSEDVSALLSGNTPQSVIDMAVPTNPVHILDLGFFLPAVIIASIMLLKQKQLAYTLSPAFIVFLILTGIPILITPIVQSARGQTAGWGVVVPIGTLTVLLLGLLAWLLSTIHSDAMKEST
jgi:hypothetical protein